MLYPLLLSLHVIICGALVLLVLLQQGKGSEMGAAFGSGASATIFGARGSGNFLTRCTAVVATLFFVSNLGLGYVIFKQTRPDAPIGSGVDAENVAPTNNTKATQPAALIPQDKPKTGVPESVASPDSQKASAVAPVASEQTAPVLNSATTETAPDAPLPSTAPAAAKSGQKAKKHQSE